MSGLSIVREPEPSYSSYSPEPTTLPCSISKWGGTYLEQREDGIFDFSPFILTQGTGSQFRVEDLIALNSSGPYDRILRSLPHELPLHSSVVSPGRMLAAIKSEISVTITEMADLLGVERPTLYSWLAEERVPHPSNRKRLNDLYDVAITWRQRKIGPLGNFRNHRLGTGQTLVSLLKQTPLPLEEIRKGLDVLSAIIEKRKTDRKPTSQELIEKYGIKARPNREEIDFVTGKRLGEE